MHHHCFFWHSFKRKNRLSCVSDPFDRRGGNLLNEVFERMGKKTRYWPRKNVRLKKRKHQEKSNIKEKKKENTLTIYKQKQDHDREKSSYLFFLYKFRPQLARFSLWMILKCVFLTYIFLIHTINQEKK